MYYAPYVTCDFSGSSLESFNSSITTYTPNNQTLADFLFVKEEEFYVELFGLRPSTNYCCFVVAKNTNGSTVSEMHSFQTKAHGKQ